MTVKKSDSENKRTDPEEMSQEWEMLFRPLEMDSQNESVRNYDARRSYGSP
jgi:hypothetical protein